MKRILLFTVLIVLAMSFVSCEKKIGDWNPKWTYSPASYELSNSGTTVRTVMSETGTSLNYWPMYVCDGDFFGKGNVGENPLKIEGPWFTVSFSPISNRSTEVTIDVRPNDTGKLRDLGIFCEPLFDFWDIREKDRFDNKIYPRREYIDPATWKLWEEAGFHIYQSE